MHVITLQSRVGTSVQHGYFGSKKFCAELRYKIKKMTVLVRAPSANTLGLYPNLDTRPPILALPSSLPSRQVRKETIHSIRTGGRFNTKIELSKPV
jgi:hypothetical protein